MKKCAGCGKPVSTKKIAGWMPGRGVLCMDCKTHPPTKPFYEIEKYARKRLTLEKFAKLRGE